MNIKNCIFSLLIILLIACQGEKKYVPDGLTKLTETELIERAKNKEVIDVENVIYKNENGEIITLDSLMKIVNIEEWMTDRYVDEKGVIKEMIIRKATQKDKELQEKLNQAVNYQPPVEIVDIDCEKKAEILEKVYALDQDMRLSDNKEDYDPQIDKQNLIKVVSLIEKCGMPTTKEVSQKQMDAIWLVFQHADNTNRKKYFPLLKKAAENGDLSKGDIALMEDRILMLDGKPQIYGSQVTKDRNTGEWMLYDLQNPETVDKRRAEVGLGTLSENLSRCDLIGFSNLSGLKSIRSIILAPRKKSHYSHSTRPCLLPTRHYLS